MPINVPISLISNPNSGAGISVMAGIRDVGDDVKLMQAGKVIDVHSKSHGELFSLLGEIEKKLADGSIEEEPFLNSYTSLVGDIYDRLKVDLVNVADKDVWIMYGQSGTGKTSALSLLVNKTVPCNSMGKLLSCSKDLKIGDGLESQTVLPSAIFIDGLPTLLDTPGINDTRTTVGRALVNQLTLSALSVCKSMRICIFVPYSVFVGGAGVTNSAACVFAEVYKVLGSELCGRLSQSVGSVSVCYTKLDNTTTSDELHTLVSNSLSSVQALIASGKSCPDGLSSTDFLGANAVFNAVHKNLNTGVARPTVEEKSSGVFSNQGLSTGINGFNDEVLSAILSATPEGAIAGPDRLNRPTVSADWAADLGRAVGIVVAKKARESVRRHTGILPKCEGLMTDLRTGTLSDTVKEGIATLTSSRSELARFSALRDLTTADSFNFNLADGIKLIQHYYAGVGEIFPFKFWFTDGGVLTQQGERWWNSMVNTLLSRTMSELSEVMRLDAAITSVLAAQNAIESQLTDLHDAFTELDKFVRTLVDKYLGDNTTPYSAKAVMGVAAQSVELVRISMVTYDGEEINTISKLNARGFKQQPRSVLVKRWMEAKLGSQAPGAALQQLQTVSPADRVGYCAVLHDPSPNSLAKELVGHNIRLQKYVVTQNGAKPLAGATCILTGEKGVAACLFDAVVQGCVFDGLDGLTSYYLDRYGFSKAAWSHKEALSPIVVSLKLPVGGTTLRTQARIFFANKSVANNNVQSETGGVWLARSSSCDDLLFHTQGATLLSVDLIRQGCVNGRTRYSIKVANSSGCGYLLCTKRIGEEKVWEKHTVQRPETYWDRETYTVWHTFLFIPIPEERERWVQRTRSKSCEESYQRTISKVNYELSISTEYFSYFNVGTSSLPDFTTGINERFRSLSVDIGEDSVLLCSDGDRVGSALQCRQDMSKIACLADMELTSWGSAPDRIPIPGALVRNIDTTILDAPLAAPLSTLLGTSSREHVDLTAVCCTRTEKEITDWQDRIANWTDGSGGLEPLKQRSLYTERIAESKSMWDRFWDRVRGK